MAARPRGFRVSGKRSAEGSVSREGLVRTRRETVSRPTVLRASSPDGEGTLRTETSVARGGCVRVGSRPDPAPPPALIDAATRPQGPSRHRLRVVLCSYLVDPASSHMLVSKIKPCMSKYELRHSETANGSLDQSIFTGRYTATWITVVILELIHGTELRPSGKSAFIRSKPTGGARPLRPPVGESE